VAYRRPELRSTVVAPIPFNWVVGTVRDWYYRLLQGPRSQVTDMIEKTVGKELRSREAIAIKSDIKLNENMMKMAKEEYERGWNEGMNQIKRNFDAYLEERKKERDAG